MKNSNFRSEKKSLYIAWASFHNVSKIAGVVLIEETSALSRKRELKQTNAMININRDLTP